MLQSDREKIFEALMYGIPRDGSAVEREMTDLVTNDIDRIEPIIDEITWRWKFLTQLKPITEEFLTQLQMKALTEEDIINRVRTPLWRMLLDTWPLRWLHDRWLWLKWFTWN